MLHPEKLSFQRADTFGRDRERQIKCVSPFSKEPVFDDNSMMYTIERDFALMTDRIIQTLVSVVPARQRRRIVPQEVGVGFAKPHKISTDLGLILPIDSNGIVRKGPAEIITPLPVRVIRECA
jgi:hypothetical protein